MPHLQLGDLGPVSLSVSCLLVVSGPQASIMDHRAQVPFLSDLVSLLSLFIISKMIPRCICLSVLKAFPIQQDRNNSSFPTPHYSFKLLYCQGLHPPLVTQICHLSGILKFSSHSLHIYSQLPNLVTSISIVSLESSFHPLSRHSSSGSHHLLPGLFAVTSLLVSLPQTSFWSPTHLPK